MVTEASSEHIVQQVNLFRYLNPNELHQVSCLFIQRNHRKKTIIFTEGSETNALFVVKSGLVKTYRLDANGVERIASYYKSGEMLPPTGSSKQLQHSVTAECIVQTVVLVLQKKKFDNFLLTQPVISEKIKRSMRENQYQLRGKQKLSGQGSQHRGKMFLLKLVEHYGNSVKGELRIGIPMTQEQLAQTIGSTKENLSLFLGQLHDEGIADMHRTGFVIHDVDSLRSWSEQL